MNPPPEQAPDNRRPEGTELTLAVHADRGGDAGTATMPDDQAVASLEAGALAPHPPDDRAVVTVTPLDPGTLGPLPPERTAQSNAYRVSIAYQPSGDVVAGLAQPGTVALTGAGPVDELLFSADGQRWERTQARPLGQGHGLSAPLTTTGWCVVVSLLPPPGEGDGSGGPTAALVIGALVAVPLLLAWLLRGRRTAGSSPGGRRTARSGRSGPPVGGRPGPRPGSATKARPKARKKRPPPPKRWR